MPQIVGCADDKKPGPLSLFQPTPLLSAGLGSLSAHLLNNPNCLVVDGQVFTQLVRIKENGQWATVMSGLPGNGERVVLKIAEPRDPMKQKEAENFLLQEWQVLNDPRFPSKLAPAAYSLGKANSSWCSDKLVLVSEAVLDPADPTRTQLAPSLKNFLQRQEQDPAVIWKYFISLVTSVAEFHFKYGAHGDLQWKNVLVDQPSLSEKTAIAKRRQQRYTQLRLIDFASASLEPIGKPRVTTFWPPESQGKTKDYDLKKGDVYALGQMLLQIYFGKEYTYTVTGDKAVLLLPFDGPEMLGEMYGKFCVLARALLAPDPNNRISCQQAVAWLNSKKKLGRLPPLGGTCGVAIVTPSLNLFNSAI
jgi:hypothetical protein